MLGRETWLFCFLPSLSVRSFSAKPCCGHSFHQSECSAFISSHRLLYENICPLKIKTHPHALVKRKLCWVEETFHFIISLFLRLPAAVNYFTPHRSSCDVSQGSFTSWKAVSRGPPVSGFKGKNCSSLQIAPSHK